MQELTIQARAREANRVIDIVAKHGRRFLYSACHDRVARLGLDNVGQVWYVDDFTGLRIYPFGDGRWPGFSHGGTLKGFVGALANYVKTGERMPASYFADDNHWAYGEAMREVRALVVQTDAVDPA